MDFPVNAIILFRRLECRALDFGTGAVAAKRVSAE